MEIVDNVYITNDYDSFKKLLGNRDVVTVNRIINSIDLVGDLKVPIIVNEKMEIIDGQHTLEARRILKLPVYYIVREGFGIKECIAMNTTSRKWDLENYIHCYAEYGYKDYQVLRDLEKKYTQQLPKAIVRSIAGGHVASIPNKEIKQGTFHLALCETEIINMLEFLSKFDMPTSLRGNAKLIYYVLRFCYEFKGVNNELLNKQWEAYSSTISGITDIKSAAEEVEKIYNYRRQKKGFVYIATEYRKAAEQKCAAAVGGGYSSWNK